MPSPVAMPMPAPIPAARPFERLDCATTSRLGPGLRKVRANRPMVAIEACSAFIVVFLGSLAAAGAFLWWSVPPVSRQGRRDAIFAANGLICLVASEGLEPPTKGL